MIGAHHPRLAAVLLAALVASCGSVSPMSAEEVADCVAAAREHGSLAGSSNIISILALWLPDDIVPAGATAEEVEEAWDTAFRENYGIGVDEFLALRAEADAATTEAMGEPPRLGEMVGNEWFVARDLTMLERWNEQYPESARTTCEVILER